MTAALPESCWPSEDQTLLLKAALLPSGEARAAWETWSRRADIDTLDGGSYRMLPLLYHNLHSAGIRHPLMNRLRGIQRYHWCRNQILIAELRGILENFEEVRVPALLLKGAALLHRYYRDPGLRPMADLDILVDPRHLQLAVDTLRRGGWSPMFPSDLEGLGGMGEKIRNGTCFTNARGTECDLHWSLLTNGAGLQDWGNIYRRSVPVSVNGRPARILCATDQLLHTCLHGGRYNELHPMRWIGDAIFILREEAGEIDWDLLLGQARELSMVFVLKETILYLRREFGAPIPSGVAVRFENMAPSFRERMEYRYATERVEGLHNLFLRDWFQFSRILPERGAPYRLLAFPAYLRNLWHLESWLEMPGHIWQRLLFRSGLSPDSVNKRGSSMGGPVEGKEAEGSPGAAGREP